MRYFLELAYKGTNYHGWQLQSNAISVQAKVEEALFIILKENIRVHGSGRTDTGVHAQQQFAHFDIDRELEPKDALHKFNAVLPMDIRAKALHLVRDNANARFDATERSYEYRIVTEQSPFLQNLALYVPYYLDVEAMNSAASYFTGKLDFEALTRAKAEVNNYICDVRRSEWQVENSLIVFHVSANRFLHGMVRAMVGTCLEVGKGKQSPEYVKDVLASKDRKEAGKAASPNGLYLTRVVYPPAIFLERNN